MVNSEKMATLGTHEPKENRQFKSNSKLQLYEMNCNVHKCLYYKATFFKQFFQNRRRILFFKLKNN